MRRFLTVAAFACIAIFWGTTSSAAQGIPQGTYQQTCNNVSVNGDTLIANCQDANGTWRTTQLPGFQRCTSEISNDNGNLRCANAGYGPAQNWRGNGPAGSYVQSCRDVKVGGDDLHARCQTNDGSWRDAKLDDYRKCKGDIVNDNGKLRCVTGAPVGGGGYYGNGPYNNGGYYGANAAGNGPNGSYTRTCMDIRVKGDDLHARCQTSSGEVHDTKLDDYRKCHSDIINDDGNLRCQR